MPFSLLRERETTNEDRLSARPGWENRFVFDQGLKNLVVIALLPRVPFLAGNSVPSVLMGDGQWANGQMGGGYGFARSNEWGSKAACLYVCMSVCLYVSMSVCLYVCMSLCLYVSMSLCLHVWNSFMLAGFFDPICRYSFLRPT